MARNLIWDVIPEDAKKFAAEDDGVLTRMLTKYIEREFGLSTLHANRLIQSGMVFHWGDDNLVRFLQGAAAVSADEAIEQFLRELHQHDDLVVWT
jgi:hypothetical protein